MAPDLRHSLLMVSIVGCLFAFQLYSTLRRRRRQRALTAAHDLPRPPRRRMHPFMIAFVVVGVSAFIAAHYYLAPTLGENKANLLVSVALFVVAFPIFFIQQLRAQHPLVRRADAIALLESSLAPDAPAQRHAALGTLLLDDNRPADAEQSFARAADLDPANPDYPVGRAVTLCKLSRPADALALLGQARVAHPHEAAVVAAACLALLDLSRDDEAREHLRQADELLRSFPTNQLTASAYPLLQLCRSRLSESSTRAFPVQTPPTP